MERLPVYVCLLYKIDRLSTYSMPDLEKVHMLGWYDFLQN
jgi:hypothetical protein